MSGAAGTAAGAIAEVNTQLFTTSQAKLSELRFDLFKQLEELKDEERAVADLLSARLEDAQLGTVNLFSPAVDALVERLQGTRDAQEDVLAAIEAVIDRTKELRTLQDQTPPSRLAAAALGLPV